MYSIKPLDLLLRETPVSVNISHFRDEADILEGQDLAIIVSSDDEQEVRYVGHAIVDAATKEALSKATPASPVSVFLAKQEGEFIVASL